MDKYAQLSSSRIPLVEFLKAPSSVLLHSIFLQSLILIIKIFYGSSISCYQEVKTSK